MNSVREQPRQQRIRHRIILILVCVGGDTVLAQALESFRRENTLPALEILLLDSNTFGVTEWFSFHRLSSENETHRPMFQDTGGLPFRVCLFAVGAECSL